MKTHFDLHVLCEKCGYEERIEYTALKAKKTHNCGQCGGAIDVSAYLKAGDEFVNRYGFGSEKKISSRDF